MTFWVGMGIGAMLGVLAGGGAHMLGQRLAEYHNWRAEIDRERRNRQ